jgi:MYXO-CTERM domain-containing protein
MRFPDVRVRLVDGQRGRSEQEWMMMRRILAGVALTAGLTLAPTINAVHAQDESTSENDDNGEIGLFGLIGLLGLAGLAGLKRRDRYDDSGRYQTTTTGSTHTR